AATLMENSQIRVGQLVLAVGNPQGLSGIRRAGIIHTDGSITSLSRQHGIQADLRLAPSNSGDPLADAQGRVAEINSMIANAKLLAIPTQVVERLLHYPESRFYLGLTLQPVLIPLKDRHAINLVVLAVGTGSPASSAGLLVGDGLLGISSQCFQAPGNLVSSLCTTESREPLSLERTWGGKRLTFQVQHQGCPPIKPEAT
ncbi:MAG TPA: hypothetical protein V6D03_14315, partial [Candidatus Caenarcaniphilales bacterium]